MDRRVEAVLFDFGGVFTGSPAAAVDEIGEEIGAAPGQLIEILFGPMNSDTDHPWHRLERGELPLAQAREEIMQLGKEYGFETDPFQVFARVGVGGQAYTVLADRVRELREEGYRTGLITNNALEFREGWRSLLPIEELFEIVVDSSEVAMRKPDPKIFQLALERLGGLPAEASVFLDDFLGNVQGASAIGMHTIHVTPDPQKTLDDLNAFLQSASTN